MLGVAVVIVICATENGQLRYCRHATKLQASSTEVQYTWLKNSIYYLAIFVKRSQRAGTN